jgi:hypothetical protein
VLFFVLSNIFAWLTQQDWTNWNMWGALGQIAGAIATVWTARIALRQVREARRQEEEARIREKEALKPELNISASTKIEQKIDKICIYLTNVKTIPVYIHKYFIFSLVNLPDKSSNISGSFGGQLNEDDIQTNNPQTIPFGDVYSIKIPIFSFIEVMKNHKQALFVCGFSKTIGAMDTCSIYVKLEYEREIPRWRFYFTLGEVTLIADIFNEEHHLVSIHAFTVEKQLEKYRRRRNNPN